MKRLLLPVIALVVVVGCGGRTALIAGEEGADSGAISHSDSGTMDGAALPPDTSPPPFDGPSPLDVTTPPDTGAGDVSPRCLPPPSGIVSWWTGDDTFADVEGLNPATADGTVTFAKGEVGEAFFLDGTSDVSAPMTDIPTNGDDRTIELWAYVTSLGSMGSSSQIFVSYGRQYPGSMFEVYASGTSLGWSKWNADITGGSISPRVWTHVAATIMAGSLTLFVDGEQVANEALYMYGTGGPTLFYMGALGVEASTGRFNLTGMLDEVTVYNRALMPAEIAGIYAAGGAGKCH